ncbi:hypothetical protein Tco_0691792 [Tanacetum coccineum]
MCLRLYKAHDVPFGYYFKSICFVLAPRFEDVGKESGSRFDSMERTLSLGSRDTKGVENSMAAPDAKLSPDLGFYMWYQSLVALDLGLIRIHELATTLLQKKCADGYGTDL